MEVKTNEGETNFFRKIWRYRKYIVVEPLVLCWVLPSCFLLIGIQNLGLEKACRISLGYSKEICDNVLYKDINEIDCDDESLTESENITITTPFENLTVGTFDFNYTVCKVETETQKRVTYINGIRGPIAAIFPIIVILFAGGWSDRTGKRKPCMIFPMIGEFLSCTGLFLCDIVGVSNSILALLISSIFMDTIPMEFGNILEKVLPAMLGGQTMMVMGIFSYLTAITPEEERTFRFGIFGMFANIVPLIGLPLAGVLLTNLGYVNLFILGDVFFLLGILYLIFFVEEVKNPVGSKSNENGEDNLAFEMASTENTSHGNNFPPKVNSEEIQKVETAKKKNFLLEFFDPTLAYACIQVFLKKRIKNRRLYLIILVFAYALFLGPTLGEVDYIYPFTLIKLKWDGELYSYYGTYNTAIVTVGTFLMTSIFSKVMKMSDSMVGLLSSICTIISRPMFAFSKDAILFYAAQTVDMFVSSKTIAIKTIISSMVDTAEIGRVYSVLGISDAIGGFIFPPIYSAVYSSTIESFPGAFFLFGEIFFIPNALLFAVTYYLLRGQKRIDDENERKEEEEANRNKEAEVTHI